MPEYIDTRMNTLSSASATMFRAFFVKAPDISAHGCPPLAPVPMPDSTSEIPCTLDPTCAPDVNSILHPSNHDPIHIRAPDVGSLASIDAVVHVLGPVLAPAAHNRSASAHITQVTSDAPVPVPQAIPVPVPSPSPVPALSDTNENLRVFDGYLSDMGEDAFMPKEEVDDWYDESHTPAAVIPMPTKDTQTVTECSAVKRRKLDIPI